jgi:hypothetical protein
MTIDPSWSKPLQDDGLNCCLAQYWVFRLVTHCVAILKCFILYKLMITSLWTCALRYKKRINTTCQQVYVSVLRWSCLEALVQMRSFEVAPLCSNSVCRSVRLHRSPEDGSRYILRTLVTLWNIDSGLIQQPGDPKWCDVLNHLEFVGTKFLFCIVSCWTET